ncbi:MAG: hypothetical protein NTW87_33330 [Planctomycetota bacterium]|nr:hypothetical protein [Planctomycetota bacterium]
MIVRPAWTGIAWCPPNTYSQLMPYTSAKTPSAGMTTTARPSHCATLRPRRESSSSSAGLSSAKAAVVGRAMIPGCAVLAVSRNSNSPMPKPQPNACSLRSSRATMPTTSAHARAAQRLAPLGVDSPRSSSDRPARIAQAAALAFIGASE